MHRNAVVAVIPAVLAMLAGAPRVLAQPSMTFESTRVVAKGFAPGAKVAWLAVTQAAPGWMRHIEPIVTVTTDRDGDGSVVLNLLAPIPGQSVWAAVDVATGAYVLDVPPTAPRRPIGDGASVVQAGQARVQFLKDVEAIKVLHLLLVRPGEGAWTLLSQDGGNYDRDGKADRSQDLRTSDFKPVIGNTDGPSSLKKDDVLVGIEAKGLHYFVVCVGKEK